MPKQITHQFYLAHPIMLREVTREYELEIEVKFPWFSFYNPFYDGERSEIDRVDADHTINPYDFPHKWIVEQDTRAILESDGIAVVLNSNVPTVGTVCEMMIAKQFNKLVYVVTNPVWENHPWIRYFSDKVFMDLMQIPEYLFANDI